MRGGVFHYLTCMPEETNHLPFMGVPAALTCIAAAPATPPCTPRPGDTVWHTCRSPADTAAQCRELPASHVSPVCTPGGQTWSGPVDPTAPHQRGLIPRPLSCCRPGDTIWLDPAQEHDVGDVVIAWPLQLRGGGAAAEDTRLLCPKGPVAALDFRSAEGTLPCSEVSGIAACDTEPHPEQLCSHSWCCSVVE